MQTSLTALRRRRCRTILIVSTLAVNVSAFAQERSQGVLVRRVVDGDTIDVATIGRVQLLGVDAPELVVGPEASTRLAREAQQRLAGLLANRWVRLEYESSAGGRSVRRAAYVFLEDGRFVNEWLVREGLARVVAHKGLRRLAELERAESEAQASQRGIWRSRPAIP